MARRGNRHRPAPREYRAAVRAPTRRRTDTAPDGGLLEAAGGPGLHSPVLSPGHRDRPPWSTRPRRPEQPRGTNMLTSLRPSPSPSTYHVSRLALRDEPLTIVGRLARSSGLSPYLVYERPGEYS